MVARKARRSRGQEPMEGSGSRPESAHGSFDAGRHMAGSQGLRREDAICGDGVAMR
jgi:hypothetical protein